MPLAFVVVAKSMMTVLVVVLVMRSAVSEEDGALVSDQLPAVSHLPVPSVQLLVAACAAVASARLRMMAAMIRVFMFGVLRRRRVSKQRMRAAVRLRLDEPLAGTTRTMS